LLHTCLHRHRHLSLDAFWGMGCWIASNFSAEQEDMPGRER
jgi:hypothetical protein